MMRKLSIMLVIFSMKLALWRMRIRLFLYTTKCSIKNFFRKKLSRLTKITDNQHKNAAKIVKSEVDKI